MNIVYVFALPAGEGGVATGPEQVVVGPAVVTPDFDTVVTPDIDTDTVVTPDIDAVDTDTIVTPAGAGETGSVLEQLWFGSFQINGAW